MENTSVKLNLKTGEIEFVGSEGFVKEQMLNLAQTLDILSQYSFHENDILDENEINEDIISEEETKISSVGENGLELTESFGEWKNKFNDSIIEPDKALLTAYFVQKNNPENDFKTNEVTQSLLDHGIKLSNPSHFLKQLEKKKLIFQTRKVGNLKYMRVSADGINHLKSLLR